MLTVPQAGILELLEDTSVNPFPPFAAKSILPPASASATSNACITLKSGFLPGSRTSSPSSRAFPSMASWRSICATCSGREPYLAAAYRSTCRLRRHYRQNGGSRTDEMAVQEPPNRRPSIIDFREKDLSVTENQSKSCTDGDADAKALRRILVQSGVNFLPEEQLPFRRFCRCLVQIPMGIIHRFIHVIHSFLRIAHRKILLADSHIPVIHIVFHSKTLHFVGRKSVKVLYGRGR